MLKYNLCLIRQGSKILLLNRESPTWMGCWNRVGGKLEPGENPRTSMLREIYEETEIKTLKLEFKGFITWANIKGTNFGGLYLYLGELPEDYIYPAFKKTEEGILDWKEIDWILHSENLGVAANLPKALEHMLNDACCFDHHSIFDGDHLVKQTSTVINPLMEEDPILRTRYLSKYL